MYPARVPTDLEQQSSELVVQAARLVRAIRRRVGQPAGIRILALLEELGPLGVTALADADRSSQPTVSGAVRLLEDEGWVEKKTDPADARRALVELTPQGRQRLLDATTVGRSRSGWLAPVTPPTTSPTPWPSSAT